MDPLLLDFPDEIVTDRLVLRIPQLGEGKEVNEAIRESIEELKPWLDFAREVPTIEDTEKDIRKAHSQFLLRENLRFHIYQKEDKQFIGSVGFDHIKWNIPKMEIAYWMRTSAGGKGYMTEAVKAASDFAFQELKANRVEIRVATKNAASRKIPEKLGYTLEGILKNDDKHSDGYLMDMCVYAKVPKE